MQEGGRGWAFPPFFVPPFHAQMLRTKKGARAFPRAPDLPWELCFRQKKRMPPRATASLVAELPLCALAFELIYSPISVTQLFRP